MSPKDMGEMLKLIREEREMSVTELAEALKMNKDTVERSEEGRGAHVFAALFKACLKFKYKATIEIKS